MAVGMIMRWLAALAVVLTACSSPAGQTTTSPPTTTTNVAPTTSTTTETDPVSIPSTLRPEVALAVEAWETDWSRTVIDLEELALGIPVRDPRDRIPPIDEPRFEGVASAQDWLDENEPGLMVVVGNEARFYPIRILHRHEIVNDQLEDVPVAVTYCPLCNTGIAFDRRVGGQTLRFGVSGLLRQSDLVMWDDESVSLWQQASGEAIVGARAGTVLELVPSAIVAWSEFQTAHPSGRVLTRDQGFPIEYGGNPYVGYSSQGAPYAGFFSGEIDPRYPAMERVVTVTIPEGAKAYPFPLLEETPAVNDSINGVPVVVLWGAPETTDPLDDADVALGNPIGTGLAHSPVVEGQVLTFDATDDGTFTDRETGSIWTLLGKAVEGPLAGTQLELLPHRNDFWFSWQAFFPDSPVWDGA